MSKTKEQIRKIAKRLIKDHKNLRLAQKDYERMSRLVYTLPAPLRQYPWVRMDMSTAPYNALRGGRAALSNLDEKLTISPITVSKDETLEAKEVANKWEYTLSHVVDRSAKRRANFRGSVIWDALVYDEICAQIVHLPTQFKVAGPKSSVREKAALRHGDWAIRLVNPQKVYAEYSDFMLERVLLVQSKTAQEIVDYWGDAAKTIRNRIAKKPEHASVVYCEFDYVDYEQRYVWVAESKSGIPVDDKGVIILKPEPWLTDEKGVPVPFLNWICVAGGTQTEDAPEFQRKPMLFAVRQTEQWASANIMRTLQMSQTIAEYGTPRDVITGPGSEDVEIDHGEPAGRMDLTAFQKYERIQALGLDPSFNEYTLKLEQEIQKASLSEVLVTGAPVGDIQAFAAYDMEVKTAVASLTPWKNLGERWYERLDVTMLLMAHYLAEDIVAYDTDATEHIIKWNDINPDRIELEVKLQPYMPTDQAQKVQTAIAMSQSLEVPTREILEWMGLTDPSGLMKEYKFEQLDRADMMGRIKKMDFVVSGEMEQMAMQRAQQIVEQQMAQQQTQQQQGPGREQPNPMGPQGIPGVEGQANNPAMGMPPPAIQSPAGNTRETQTGLTRAQPREV